MQRTGYVRKNPVTGHHRSPFRFCLRQQQMIEWIAVAFYFRKTLNRHHMMRFDVENRKAIDLGLPQGIGATGGQFAQPEFDRDFPKRNDAYQNLDFRRRNQTP